MGVISCYIGRYDMICHPTIHHYEPVLYGLVDLRCTIVYYVTEAPSWFPSEAHYYPPRLIKTTGIILCKLDIQVQNITHCKTSICWVYLFCVHFG